MVEMLFPSNDAIFQDNSSPTHIHASVSVQSWFDENDDALQHLPWPAQSPYLNIIVPLWSVLVSRVRSRFPSPSSLKQLHNVLHEQRYNMPPETIQNLHESIPRRIQAVLQANCGPSPC